MKVAIPVENGRLNSHFGGSRQFALIEVDQDTKTVLRSETLPAPEHQPGLFPRWLREQGVQVLLAGGLWLGGRFSVPASWLHPTVNLAERFVRERDTPPKTGTLTDQDLALARARQNPKELLTDAAAIRQRFRVGGWVFGAWVGLVIGAKLINLSVYRPRTDYEPERGACFACARCFEYCPRSRAARAPAEGKCSSAEATKR